MRDAWNLVSIKLTTKREEPSPTRKIGGKKATFMERERTEKR